jgi:hypothetical protein
MPRGVWRPPDRVTRVHGPTAAFKIYKRAAPSPRLSLSTVPLFPNILAPAALIVRRLAPSARSTLHGPAQRIPLLGLAAAENPQWHINASQSHNLDLRPPMTAPSMPPSSLQWQRPLSIDVLVVRLVKMRERAELRSARPASLAPFLVAAHI